jgi:pimeloyl-ACP methyl ester carboxylesterase
VNDLSLILLPGLDGSGVLFRPLIPHLPPQIRPIIVSYPRDKTLEYRELLPLVLSAIPASGPFIILGESFSGPLALMAAATCPPRLRAVIMCASFIRAPWGAHLKFLRYFANSLTFQFYPVAAFGKAILGGYSTPEWRALKSEAIAGIRPAVVAQRVRASLMVDVTSELKSCSAPILYLQGERDRVVPPRNLKEILAARGDVKVERFPSPHMVLQTQPVLAAAAIAAFAATV